MAEFDFDATQRVGTGYVSTTFITEYDPEVISRKWIFGDGSMYEGNTLEMINHTYYIPGEYDVTLIVRTRVGVYGEEQHSVTKSKFIIVEAYTPIPEFIIAQSFDVASGEYWRLYFDQDFYLVFEDNANIFRTKYSVVSPGKWVYIDFDRRSGKMKIGYFSYYIKEFEVVRYENLNPMTFTETGTQILLNSTMKIDEFRIWSVSKDTVSDYTNSRGRAGYLDTLEK